MSKSTFCFSLRSQRTEAPATRIDRIYWRFYGLRELLAAIQAVQAKKVRANVKKQEGLVAQGAELVRQYQDRVKKLLEDEEMAM